jgi:hypothetical protein
MKKCKNCGKQLTSGSRLDFYSKECMKQYRENKLKILQRSFLTQFDKGFGSSRRQHNIQVVKNMLEEGYSEEQIIKIASVYFRKQTVFEYLEIAKSLLEIEGEKL